jgi:hypothetical protein
MAHRSQSFAYGTKSNHNNDTNTASPTISPLQQQRKPIYSALLSRIATELRQSITLSDHVKDDIEYKNTFDGKEVVVCVIYVKRFLSFFISIFCPSFIYSITALSIG